MKLKKTQLLVLGALAFTGAAAFAQAAKAPEPDYTWAFNAGVVTDYRFRGISQTRLKPALQGGIDFTHKSGFYVGTWLSSIKILKDIPGGKGSLEWDIYGGYRGSFNDALSYDVGLLRYEYPSQNFTPTVNTTELYGALTYKVVTLKYSSSLDSQTFGVGNSRGSGYLEAVANFDLGNGWTVAPHIGHQRFSGTGNGIASYTDYSVTVGKDLGNGFSVSAALVGTDAGPFYTSAPTAGSKDLGKDTLVLGVKYSF